MSTSQEFPAFVNHHFGVILIDGESRKMLQEHFFDFLAKLSGKENILKLFRRKKRESLLSSNERVYTFAKLVLFRLLVLVDRDSVMTISAVVYNVNNNLDEVTLAPYFALCTTGT